MRKRKLIKWLESQIMMYKSFEREGQKTNDAILINWAVGYQSGFRKTIAKLKGDD
ncbi:MAG: hypothetical protein GY853_16585 [PVC group bacterium]|nr:hypothetical protein [PVC group bacterium]